MNKTFKELGFKDGDTVVCTDTKQKYFYKKGDKFTLKHFKSEIRTDCAGFDGSLGEWELVEKDMGKFKVGDKVRVIKSTGYCSLNKLEIGGIYKISSGYTREGFMLKSVDKNHCVGFVYKDEIELCSEDMFEDQWHLNDGKVEIPYVADKLEKDGSVVAFRKRKTKLFEFGEKLRIKKSLWPSDVIDMSDINPGLDYVDAVYISKYFDLNGVEGIKVYIDNGEKGWECCLTSLDKVERLT